MNKRTIARLALRSAGAKGDNVRVLRQDGHLLVLVAHDALRFDELPESCKEFYRDSADRYRLLPTLYFTIDGREAGIFDDAAAVVPSSVGGCAPSEGMSVEPECIRKFGLSAAPVALPANWAQTPDPKEAHVELFPEKREPEWRDKEVVIGGGATPDGDPVMVFLVNGAAGDKSIGWYMEFEGYRLWGLVPTGMSMRYFGVRFRDHRTDGVTAGYVATGPYLVFPRNPPEASSAAPGEDEKRKLILGWDGTAYFRFRQDPLPEFRGRIRASVGAQGEFLEYSASIDTGAWGELLSTVLGFGLATTYRTGAPWSKEIFDETTFVGLARVYW